MMTRTSSLWAAASARSLSHSLALAAPAAAAPRADHSHEHSFGVGREGVVEEGLLEDLLAERPVAPVGLRAGYGLAGPWSVVAGWQRAVDRSGMHGLRVTKIQHYRDLYERQLKY